MKKFNQEWILLAITIILFIALRSINFIYHVNWSGDQASFGIEALRIFQTKTITLIGPQISANLGGHFIFQGPLIYYFFLFFLALGRWDPVIASYLFMLFCAFMTIPLYFGVKKLINPKAAWIAVIFYSFFPYFVNYTRFLWNSTLLFALLPPLLLLMGLYKEKRTPILFLTLSTWLGILLQFHYQFVIVIFGILLYYFFVLKTRVSFIFLFIIGIAIGFFPIILFELRHHFYNISTLILFIKNWENVDKPGGFSTPHYFLSISFMVMIALLSVFSKQLKKTSRTHLLIFAGIMFLYATALYIPRPIHAFWAPASPWNYLVEKKIYETIKSTGMTKNFNVANLAYYDTPAVVIKYFMKRDGYTINYEDYYQNKYLFVVSEGQKYLTNPSYEVAMFKPHKFLEQWKINERYTLFLLEREKT